MKRLAVVTGATGCIGRNLVDELLLEGWDIIALHRKSSDVSRLRGCEVRLQVADLHDLESVRSAIPSNVDAIFHAAANLSHWPKEAERQWKDNVLATRHLVQAALDKGVKRFIFTSTGATLNLQGADEQYTRHTQNGYVRTKRLSEIEIERGIESGLDAVFLHPIVVIGPYDYNNYSQIFRDIRSGKITKSLPGRICICHAKDVARAHLQAYYHGRCRESYFLAGPYTAWLDVFQRIARTVGVRPPLQAYSRRSLLALSYVMQFASFFTRKKPELTPELVGLIGDCPDLSFVERRKAKEVLGYESASLDQMIQDCYEWLLREGLLEKAR